jgi:hypothetical protein
VKVVFLLGAGASRGAGVPLVQEFVTEFRETLQDADKALLDRLIDALLPGAPGGIVDVERVLDATERIPYLGEDVTVALLGGKDKLALGSPDELMRLGELLKQYIRKRCSQDVTPDGVRYLAPLLDFTRLDGTLDIFSLNYDMCVEMVAEENRIAYTDGFDLEWRKTRLDERGTPDAPLIRLHKIHGSVVWYRRSDYRYVKIPLLPTEEPIRYFTHEKVLDMMLYPALTKAGDAGPYQELVHRFRNALTEATVLVCIGYRFRDTPIRNLVQEAASANRRLVLFLVGPDAVQIKDAVFSALGLALRTIAVPLRAEAALRDGRLFAQVQELATAEAERAQAEAEKPLNFYQAKVLYTSVIRRFVGLGNIEAARLLAESEETNNPFKATNLQLHPLPRLDFCLQFALRPDANQRVWWKLVSILLYWWEQNQWQLRNLGASWLGRAGIPNLDPSGWGPSKDDVERVKVLAKEHNDRPSRATTDEKVFYRQLGRLVEISDRLEELMALNDRPAAQLNDLMTAARDYAGEPGASQAAAVLGGWPPVPIAS